MVNAAIDIQKPAVNKLPAYVLTQYRPLRISLNDILERQDAKRVVSESRWKELQDLAVDEQTWLKWVWSFFRSCVGR